MNKAFTQLMSIVALAWLLTGTALSASIIGFETPVDGQVISGKVLVSGWAVDANGIDEVEIYFDNSVNGIDLGYGIGRADVGNAYPSIPNSSQSGFSGIINSRMLSNGPHVLRIEVKNNLGEETSLNHTIVVSNEPGENWPPPVLDLNQASARVVDGVIYLDNVLIDGVLLNNLDLFFDAQTRKFSFSAFDDDLNGDGYHDDDLNGDGYHDDDVNYDGEHDGDDGTVQPGIPMALAEVKGEVLSVNGNSIVVFSTDPEHGGAVGNVTVDITNAVLDDSLGGQVDVGEMVEAKGSWDGSVLSAVTIELD